MNAAHVARLTNTVADHGKAWLCRALGLGEGQDPFPWQLELLRCFRRGDSIQALDIPTGLGKTATMAIWLIARALGADLPRRLVYVVDRRAVVDQATDEAERIRKVVDEMPELKSALGLSRSLHISTLRGQHVDNRQWLEDPSLPAIVIGTVDMIGSRLLFSGYGVSSKMRPYHAGLLGADTLVVLDEAHLVPPFEELLRRIESSHEVFGPRKPAFGNVVPKFKLLSLSATGRVVGATALALSEDDRNHAVVKERLRASKRLTVNWLGRADEGGTEESKEKAPKIWSELAAKAWELSKNGTAHVRCLVFCDLRKDATAVAEELRKRAKSDGVSQPNVELFVGGRRVRERTRARESLAQLGFLAGSSFNLNRAAFLIATSAGEVGVDLDADHMVCDLVAWERMVQRLGRVNRRGGYDQSGRLKEATVVVVVGIEPVPSDPIKRSLEKRDAAKDAENRLQEVLQAMQRLQVEKQSRPKGKKKTAEDKKAEETLKQRERELKAGAAKLQKRVDAFKDDDARLVAQHEREIAHATAQRALLKAVGENGELSPAALIQLKAREDLRELLREATTTDPLRPALTRALVDAWSMTSLEDHTGRPEVDPWLRGWNPSDPPQTSIVWRRHLPVRADEKFDRKAAKRFFEAAPPHASELLETETDGIIDWLLKRAETVGAAAPDPLGCRFGEGSVVAIALTSRGEVKGWTLEELRPVKEKEGKKVREQLKELLAGSLLVVDARLGGLTNGLLDHKATTAEAADDETTTWLAQPEHATAPVTGFRVLRLQAGLHNEALLRGSPGDGWVRRHVFVTDAVDGEPRAVLAIDGWVGDSATEEDRAEASRPQELNEHQSWAEDCAREIARRVGLNDEYGVLLQIAARLHDEGKRAARWQRAFRAPRDGNVYAKTKGPIDFAHLDGYRHELGSLSYVEKDPQFQALSQDAQDLVLHLVTTHHGRGRPLIDTTGFDQAPPSAVVSRAREVAVRFARLQRHWGPWGLAWWEALLRAADQAASRRNQESGFPTPHEEHG
jgi:CRISPR-associated endonuclease/helicase Cas3